MRKITEFIIHNLTPFSNDPTGHQEKESDKGVSDSGDSNSENPTEEVSEKQEEEGIFTKLWEKFTNFCDMMGKWAKVEILGLTSTERGSSSQAKESYQLGAQDYLDIAPKSGAQLKDVRKGVRLAYLHYMV